MKLQLRFARSIHARHMLEIIVLGGALRAAERFNQKEVERSFSAVFQTHGSPSFIYKVDQRLE